MRYFIAFQCVPIPLKGIFILYNVPLPNLPFGIALCFNKVKGFFIPLWLDLGQVNMIYWRQIQAHPTSCFSQKPRRPIVIWVWAQHRAHSSCILYVLKILLSWKARGLLSHLPTVKQSPLSQVSTVSVFQVQSCHLAGSLICKLSCELWGCSWRSVGS